MSAEDRAARQRAADLDGRQARIDALFEPMPYLEPVPLLPRVAYPRKLEAERIPYDALFGAGTLDDLVRDVQDKLTAEAARLRRLLPPPLPGFEWRGEIAHDMDWVGDFTATDTIRLRYRMVRIGGEV